MVNKRKKGEFLSKLVHFFLFIVIQECMQMPGWQQLMRTAVLCSRAEYFTDQHQSGRQIPLGEWFVLSDDSPLVFCVPTRSISL